MCNFYSADGHVGTAGISAARIYVVKYRNATAL